jgi:hypothetical protein
MILRHLPLDTPQSTDYKQQRLTFRKRALERGINATISRETFADYEPLGETWRTTHR